MLELYASKIGKTRGTLGIYDPYYCAGGMLQHLARLGFTNVHNTNQDCYKVQSKLPFTCSHLICRCDKTLAHTHTHTHSHSHSPFYTHAHHTHTRNVNVCARVHLCTWNVYEFVCLSGMGEAGDARV